jgi:hypothetical protein
MFGAEPQEEWSKQEVEEFARYCSIQLRACVMCAVRAAFILLVSIFVLLPFTAGHSLNKHWNSARFLVYVTLGCFLWFFYKCMLIWTAWQSSRETKREFGDPR